MADDLEALRVRLDAARALIAAAVRLAEAAGDLLIEQLDDEARRRRAAADTHPAVFGLPVHGRADKGTVYADPHASIPSSRLRD